MLSVTANPASTAIEWWSSEPNTLQIENPPHSQHRARAVPSGVQRISLTAPHTWLASTTQKLYTSTLSCWVLWHGNLPQLNKFSAVTWRTKYASIIGWNQAITGCIRIWCIAKIFLHTMHAKNGTMMHEWMRLMCQVIIHISGSPMIE